MKKTTGVFLTTVGGAVINIVLNIFLTRPFGIIGTRFRNTPFCPNTLSVKNVYRSHGFIACADSSFVRRRKFDLDTMYLFRGYSYSLYRHYRYVLQKGYFLRKEPSEQEKSLIIEVVV